jgi:lipopolysaccharide/colanic/teichoic acid biosynthesis glycosyltransferase
LCNIPVIVDTDNIDEAKQQALKNLNLVDDSIALGSIDKKFINRINFLGKVKKAENKISLEDKIETSLNEVAVPIPFLKRTFDIVVSSVLLTVLSPLFLIIALIIKFESKGSVFYTSKRAGRGYKVFDFYKFRSMAVDADKQVDTLVHLNQYSDLKAEGPVFFKLNNDPRVTKVGTFLRNTSLDELPQLINVFLGDMSLVGNRPLPLYEAATLTTDKWVERFMAPAGITGLWQIKKRGQSDMSIEERLNLDIDYAKKYSFMFDLWIMVNTPSALIQKSNV